DDMLVQNPQPLGRFQEDIRLVQLADDPSAPQHGAHIIKTTCCIIPNRRLFYAGGCLSPLVSAPFCPPNPWFVLAEHLIHKLPGLRLPAQHGLDRWLGSPGWSGGVLGLSELGCDVSSRQPSPDRLKGFVENGLFV